jgi:dimethylaniline monooxygenase (N-oxide forming)
MAEFSDMPMQLTPDENVEQSLMTGKAVTRYLEEYLDRHSHNGSSLRARLHLNFDVKKVERGESAWTINGRNADGTRATFRSLKLVVATGTTSEPHFPQLPNRDLFDGLVVHQSGFGASPILSSDSIQNVTILGGAKSAADMVYACVKAGKTVTWLIRESGAGPATFLSAEGRGTYRNHPEYASTRIMGSLSPSPWAPENSRTKFMGRTVLGRSIMVSPWANADKMVHTVFDEAREMGVNEEFQQLRPRGTYVTSYPPSCHSTHVLQCLLGEQPARFDRSSGLLADRCRKCEDLPSRHRLDEQGWYCAP